MLIKCSDHESSTVYKVGVLDGGNFDEQVEARAVRRDDVANLKAYWNHLGVPVGGVYLACLEAEAGYDSHLRMSEYKHFLSRT